MTKAAALLGLIGLAIAAAFPLAVATRSQADQPQLGQAQSDYLEHCGGCHGLQGSTAPAPIPVLRDRAGFLACTDAGREYLLRLPNVAHSQLDDEALADMMTFVVFDLGGGSRSLARRRPFTTEEVAKFRSRAMIGSAVEETRKIVVEQAIKTCGAPASLRAPYPAAPAR